MGITIKFEDTGATLETAEGETLLDAFMNNGVSYAHSCRSGNCGTCKIEF